MYLRFKISDIDQNAIEIEYAKNSWWVLLLKYERKKHEFGRKLNA